MWQQISLIGNAGQDPEMRYMPDGTAVTNISIATNRTWNIPDQEEKQQETTWWRVSFWGKQAEVITEYLSKGDKSFIQGIMKPDPKTGGPRMFTRHDGTVGASFEIRAFSFQFLQGRDETQEPSERYSSGRVEPVEEDEIPF